MEWTELQLVSSKVKILSHWEFDYFKKILKKQNESVNYKTELLRNRIIYLCFRILLLTLSIYFNGVNLLCRYQFFLFTFVSYWEMYYFLIEQDKSPRYWKRYLIHFFYQIYCKLCAEMMQHALKNINESSRA